MNKYLAVSLHLLIPPNPRQSLYLGRPQTLEDSLTLRYRPWRLPLGEDRAGSP
jgi:hypothetical protein